MTGLGALHLRCDNSNSQLELLVASENGIGMHNYRLSFVSVNEICRCQVVSFAGPFITIIVSTVSVNCKTVKHISINFK